MLEELYCTTYKTMTRVPNGIKLALKKLSDVNCTAIVI